MSPSLHQTTGLQTQQLRLAAGNTVVIVGVTTIIQ
jgi:hypothetical protein